MALWEFAILNFSEWLKCFQVKKKRENGSSVLLQQTYYILFSQKKINLNAWSWCLPCQPSNYLRCKTLAYLMKMHRSLQPHLLEKYYLEVPFFQGQRFALGLCFFCFHQIPLNVAGRGAHRLRHDRVPPQTQANTAQEAWGSRQEPGLSFPAIAFWSWHSWGKDTPEPSAAAAASGLPVELAFHLFFTNFFLEALGFNRLLPAPKVLSRTCSIAERLEMSFSAKGDAPAT